MPKAAHRPVPLKADDTVVTCAGVGIVNICYSVNARFRRHHVCATAIPRRKEGVAPS
jgi:hypothetical protein